MAAITVPVLLLHGRQDRFVPFGHGEWLTAPGPHLRNAPVMAHDIAGDIRLDPRVKAFLADDEAGSEGDIDSREALLAEANSQEARAGAEGFRQFMERFDTEEVAPSAGLRIHAEKVISQPDGNAINLQVIRPDNDETLACVYYIHGGGNLTLATGLKLKQDGELGLISGLYAMAPFIRGQWPAPDCPSSTENNGIVIDVHTNRGTVGYGIEAFTERNPLAWPSFATAADVEGFPPVVISVNECDPLRDEGINFYRLLLAVGIPARCRQVMGTVHAVEAFTTVCPEISRDTAGHLAALWKG